MVHIVPPYHIPQNTRETKQTLSDLTPFFRVENSSSIQAIASDTHNILTIDTPEAVMQYLATQYPDKLLLPSSYLLGERTSSIVVLTSEPYGMLAIPGWKSDGGTIAEILEKQRHTLQPSFARNDLSSIMRDLHTHRTPHIGARLFHLVSALDMRNDKPVNRYDRRVMDILHWQDPDVQLLLKEKLIGIPKEEWLSVLLAYKKETIEEILHREYREETWREIITKKLLFVQLEEKWKNMLKVRFYFGWNVGNKQEDAVLHTTKEKIGNWKQEKMVLPDALVRSRKLLEQKLWIQSWYSWNNKLQHKKLSAAFWHWLALELSAYL